MNTEWEETVLNCHTFSNRCKVIANKISTGKINVLISMMRETTAELIDSHFYVDDFRCYVLDYIIICFRERNSK